MLDMPYAHFTYTVTGKRVVAPTDVQAAVGNVGYSRLVLSACTPLFSAAKRLLIYARLTRTVPAGRGGAGGRKPARRRAGAPARATRARPRARSLPAVLEPLEPHALAPLV